MQALRLGRDLLVGWGAPEDELRAAEEFVEQLRQRGRISVPGDTDEQRVVDLAGAPGEPGDVAAPAAAQSEADRATARAERAKKLAAARKARQARIARQRKAAAARAAQARTKQQAATSSLNSGFGSPGLGNSGFGSTSGKQ